MESAGTSEGHLEPATSGSSSPVHTRPQTPPLPSAGSSVKRPDRVQPYRLDFWTEVLGDDGISDAVNLIGMVLSMMGILLKYKACAWLGLLAGLVSFANAPASADSKQLMSTFMLSLSAVVMCYLTNPQGLSVQLGWQITTHGGIPLDAASHPQTPKG